MCYLATCDKCQKKTWRGNLIVIYALYPYIYAHLLIITWKIKYDIYIFSKQFTYTKFDKIMLILVLHILIFFIFFISYIKYTIIIVVSSSKIVAKCRLNRQLFND